MRRALQLAILAAFVLRGCTNTELQKTHSPETTYGQVIESMKAGDVDAVEKLCTPLFVAELRTQSFFVDFKEHSERAKALLSYEMVPKSVTENVATFAVHVNFLDGAAQTDGVWRVSARD